MLLLLRVYIPAVVPEYIVMCGKQETTGSAGRIAHRIIRSRLHHVHDGLDKLPWSEVLTSSLR